MTAGMVPAFVDVVLNFASSEFTEDNLISKARNAGRRLLFYGDDTWLRLFPAHFQDSDGVTSFIVSDYTEVKFRLFVAAYDDIAHVTTRFRSMTM